MTPVTGLDLLSLRFFKQFFKSTKINAKLNRANKHIVSQNLEDETRALLSIFLSENIGPAV